MKVNDFIEKLVRIFPYNKIEYNEGRYIVYFAYGNKFDKLEYSEEQVKLVTKNILQCQINHMNHNIKREIIKDFIEETICKHSNIGFSPLIGENEILINPMTYTKLAKGDEILLTRMGLVK